MNHGAVFDNHHILPSNTKCAIPDLLSHCFERVIREADEHKINSWVEEAKERMLWALDQIPVPPYDLEARTISREGQ